MRGEEVDRHACPGLRRTGGRKRFVHQRLRLQHRVPVLEERVRVRHAVVGPGVHAQDRLAAAHMLEVEAQSVDLEARAGGDELGRVLLVLAALSRAAGQPEPVVSPLGRAQRREGEHVTGIDILSRSDRFQHGASGELFGRVAEHRPVRDLAGRRLPGPDGVDQATRAPLRERVEVRRVRYLVRGSSAERLVRAVGEPVEEDDEDRIHTRRLTG